MENEKNDNNYDNESYLSKREDPKSVLNSGAPEGIKNKGKEKPDDHFKESNTNPTKNISDDEMEDDQREMYLGINRKKSRDFSLPLILGVMALIIIGVAAVYFLASKEGEEEKENPQQIIKSAMQEMQRVKTYNYDGVIKFGVENKENLENFDFDIEFSGKADQTNVEDSRSFNNLKALADISMEGGSQELSFDLDTVQIGQKKTYFRLNDFDLGMIGMMMGPEVNSFKEKWYKMDLEELEELNAASGGMSMGSMGMATYDINKIMELYNKYELLKFEKDLGEARLENINAYHYAVKLDGVALANFYVEMLKEMIREQDSDEMYGEIFEEIEENIKKYDYVMNDVADNVNTEIWIGKEDKLIYTMKMDGEFDKEFMKMIKDAMIAKGDISKGDVIDELNDDADILLKFNIDINMRGFNQPVEVIEPEGAESFLEVLEKMSEGFSETDTDGDGLSDYAEDIYYGSDPNNPDTDGDGYKDGEEVENGYDPIVPGSARLDYDELFKKGWYLNGVKDF